MKENNPLALSTDNLKSRIYTIRNMQVMLDADLAELYNVETKQFNRAVKRNIERFPREFMFQLTEREYNSLRLQIVTLKKEGSGNLESQFPTLNEQNLRCQFGTSRLDWGGKRYLPYAFTEQGVAMLSGVLKSDTVVQRWFTYE